MAKAKKLQAFPKPHQNNPFITNSQRRIAVSLPSAQKVVSFLLEKSGSNEMQVHFVGKKKIASLHVEFFNDPSPTDCITFPYDEGDFLGEVFVCPQVAEEYTQRFGGSLQEEITLYILSCLKQYGNP